MPNYEKKPHLEKYRYSASEEGKLEKQFCIRLTNDMYEAIKKVPNHRELIRVLLQEWLDSLNSDDTCV